jgi:hypothetical protein
LVVAVAVVALQAVELTLVPLVTERQAVATADKAQQVLLAQLTQGAVVAEQVAITLVLSLVAQAVQVTQELLTGHKGK